MARLPYLICMAGLLFVVAMVSGCTEPVIEMITIDLPAVETNPRVSQEETLLESYQEVSKKHEAEKSRADSLEARLAEETAARNGAEAELEELRRRVEALEKNEEELADLKTKYGEAQNASLALASEVSELRRELVQSKLDSVKYQKTILNFRIQEAKDRRKELIEQSHIAAQRLVPKEAPDEKENNGENL